MRRIDKEKINALMNIDNYFGKYESGPMRVIMFLIACATPVMAYIFITPLQLIPIRWMLFLEILWGIRMAFLILGKENEKVAQYKKDLDIARAEQLALKGEGDASVLSKDDASDLIRIVHTHEDGLIEFSNGNVCYVLSGFVRRFEADATFSIHMEEFLNELGKHRYIADLHLHMVIDEDRLYDNPDLFRVYQDKELLKDRVDFYRAQDDYCNKKSTLFRFNIPVKTSKYNWKELKEYLEEFIESYTVKELFTSIKICNREEVSNVSSRDIGAHLDINRMLHEKYNNTEYYGAKVLYYGDDVPEDYLQNKETVNMKERRIVEYTNKES